MADEGSVDDVDDVGSKPAGQCDAFNVRYVFTITSVVNALAVGQTAQGQRIDVQYPAGQVNAIKTEPGKFIRDWWRPLSVDDKNKVAKDIGCEAVGATLTVSQAYTAIEAFRANPTVSAGPLVKSLQDGVSYPLAWFGLAGAIMSGSDWVLLRKDGVAEFLGRFTLGSNESDKGLIDAAITGVVDALLPGKQRDRVFSDWELGVRGAPLKLLLAATFDAAGSAPSWAPSRMIAQAAGFWKYQRLTQGQFIAVGTAMVDARPFNPITGVELDVYEARPK